MPLAGVIRAENYATFWNLQFRIDRARDRAGVNVSRMRSDTTDGGEGSGDGRSVAPGSVGQNVAQQFVSAARIKLAGNGGSSHRSHDKLVWSGRPRPLKMRAKIQPARSYEPPSRNARNKAAVLSSGSASARIAGFTPLFASAARSVSSSYRVFRLFQRVLRFCPKQSFRKAMNSVSGTCSDSRRGLIVIRTTLECTFGAGAKAPGGRVKSFSTRP